MKNNHFPDIWGNTYLYIKENRGQITKVRDSNINDLISVEKFASYLVGSGKLLSEEEFNYILTYIEIKRNNSID